MICLRTQLPEVQAQLQEYTNILGDSDAAYYVLSENNGYGLDYAPNGVLSKLFSDLLDHYNGDVNKAIQEKVKVYSEDFRNLFGDWLSEDTSDVFNIVDENGEPLMTYVSTFSTDVADTYNNQDVEDMTTDLPSERVERVGNYVVSKLTLKTLAYRPKRTKYLPDLLFDLNMDLFGVHPDITADIRDGKYLDEIEFFIYNELYGKVEAEINEVLASLANIKEISEVQINNTVRSYLYDNNKLLSDYSDLDRRILTQLLSQKAIKRDKKAIGYYKHMLASKDNNRLKTNIRNISNDSRIAKFKLLARLNKLQTVLDTLDIVPSGRKMMFDKFVSEYMRYLVYDGKPSNNKSGNLSRKKGFAESIELFDLLSKYYDSPYEENQIFSIKLMEEGTNALDALRTIIQNSKDPVAVELARNILPYVSKDTKISFLGVNKNGKLSMGGTFSGKTGNIEIYTFSNLFLRHPEFTVIHEIVHSISVDYISNHPELYKELQNIIDFLASNSILSQYAFTDPYELVAEFLSNPAFREYTKNIEVEGLHKNLFLRILDTILGWIGPNERLTAFDYLEDITNDIILKLYDELSSNTYTNNTISLDFNVSEDTNDEFSGITIFPDDKFRKVSFYESLGIGERHTASELLLLIEYYFENEKNPTTRRLLDLFKQSDVVVNIVDPKSHPDLEGYYAYYDPKVDLVFINSTVFERTSLLYNTITLMHELVHAHTARMASRVENSTATKQERAVYRQCELIRLKLAKRYKHKRKTDGKFDDIYYGLNNVHEFMAELLSNRQFYKLVEQESIDSNWYETFINFIRNLAETIVHGFNHRSYTKENVAVLTDDLVNIISYDIEDRINDNTIQLADNNLDLGKLLNTELLYNQLPNIPITDEDRRNLDIVLQDLAEHILSGFESMLKVSNDPDPVLRALVRAQAEWQIANIRDGLVDNLTNVINFLNNLGSQLSRITEEVVYHSQNNIPFTDEKLNDLDQNFYGFYNTIVDKIVKDLSLNRPFREILGQDNTGKYILDKLVDKALIHQVALHKGHAVVQREIVRNAQTRMKEIGIKVNPEGLYEYSQYSTEQLRDVNFITYSLGAADKVNNDAVKSIFYLIDQANEDTHTKVNQLQIRLLKLLKKAGKYNQRLLLEVDDDGNTTQWFVRSRNFGKFEKNYREAMDKICLSLGVDPTEVHLPENKAIRIEYNKLRNEWLSRHCDRRFTKEYYDLFNSLSEETLKQREAIQVQIRKVLADTVDEYGMYHRDKLTEEGKKTLVALNLQKKQLASIYDINGVKKQGIQLLIAEELTELNTKLSKGLSRTKISEAFHKKRDLILNDNNLSQREKDEWIKNNTRQLYKQEFYDKLRKLEKKYYGDKYAAASERRRSILSLFRDDSTGEVMVEYMPKQTKLNLSKLESVMRAQRNVAINRGQVQKIDGEYTFEEIAHVVPTSRWYADKRKYYDSELHNDPEVAEAWLNANAFVTKVLLPNGKYKFEIRPKSWYTKIVPNDPSMIETVPTQDWMEIDESSEFINKDYLAAKKEDPELIDEYWIPKKQVIEDGKTISYDSSERFNRVKKNKHLDELRTELLKVIRETNNLMSNLHKTYPYRVPQRRGSLATYINAGMRSDGFVGAIKSVIDYVTDFVSVKNDDPGFNKALVKPNGDRLNLIPQNYVGLMEDPKYLSADVVGNVVAFYRSGLNWHNKTKIQPQIELLKQYLSGLKFKSSRGAAKLGKDSNTYKLAKAFIDMNLYDIRHKVAEITIGKPNDNGRIFGVLPQHFHLFGLNFMPYVDIEPITIDITKMLNILKRVGTTVNLGLNLSCALTGGTTALYSHIVNALVGRYYNSVDAGYALKNMLTDLLLNVINRTGVVQYKPKMSRLMEYYRVGADNRLDPTNRLNIINQIIKHAFFGAYTLLDHIVKGLVLGAVANNFKLVIDSKGNKRFMCREDYKREMLNNSTNLKEMIDWSLGDRLSFYDAIDIIDGEIVAKDPENQKYVDEVKHQIGSIARVLAGSVDGQLTELQQPVLAANAFGQLAMMHRQYLPIILLERFGMSLQYDYQMRKQREALFLSLIRVLKEAIAVNDSAIRHIKKSYKNDVTFRENIRKLFFEIGLWLVLSLLIRPMVVSSADLDKKNIIKQIIAYAMEKTVFETLAPYNVIDMLNTLKSPSAIMSYVQTTESFLTNIYSILSESAVRLFSDEPPRDRLIKKGAYKNMTPLQRDIIKFTPFKNLIELQDIQSKRNYYRRMILNEKD